MREVTITSSEQPQCRAEVAENPWTRSWGLLGRKGLPENQGIWIRKCKYVHTFFMRFPIDVVYLAADGTVVKTCTRLIPFRFSAGSRRADSVLELPAGFLDRREMVVGDKLVMAPADQQTVDTTACGGIGTDSFVRSSMQYDT